MKRFSFLLLAILPGTFGTLHADLTVVQKIDGMAGIASESTTKIKDGKMRVDAMAGMSMVLDSTTGDILNIMHTQKSYMKIPAEMAKMAISKMGQDAAAGAKPKLTATGKKETINSFPCEEYTCEIAGRTVTMWLTTALPNYKTVLKELSNAMNQGPLAATMQSFNVYSDDLPGFPVRTISEIAPGQTITATTVSVDTKPVDSADFAIPAGYKEIAMPMLTPPAVKGTPAAE